MLPMPSTKPNPTKPTKSKKPRKKRYRNQVANPAASHTDVIIGAGAGLVAYGATRMTGRIAFMVAERKAPRFSRHAYVAASILAAVAVYLISRSMKRMHPHHKAVVVGSVIAAIQATLQTYFPALGWVLAAPTQADYTQLPGVQLPALPAPSNHIALAPPPATRIIQDDIIPEASDEDQDAEGMDNVFAFPVITRDIG